MITSAAPQAPTRPFVRAWTIDDLVGKLEHIHHGRDAAHGKALFTELACVQCHRMNGAGGQVGTDLAGVKEKLAGGKMTTADVLTEMIEPSKVIDKPTASCGGHASPEDTFTGMRVEEAREKDR